MVDSRVSDPVRLAVLGELDILDTPAEPAYDDIAQLASVCCASDIAAVNFVDDVRHWTKAVVGIEDRQGASVSADLSLCAATVATESGLLNVADTLASDAWKSHPFVAGAPHLRFYAGAAIVVEGQPVGVVCVFGDGPRELAPAQEQALVALAGQAAAQLELRRRNAELQRVAVSDPLTGLANRTLLHDHLELAIAQRARAGGQVGVLFCDVDDFKSINDRFGHEAGDRVLCRIADRLREATRDTDTVARFGGDEFAVVCSDLQSPETLDDVVERVRQALHAHVADDGGPSAKVTIGAALLRDGEAADAVLRRADQAMYERKALAARPGAS